VVSCFDGGPPFEQLHRLFRLASKAAVEAGQPPTALRRRLAETIRRHARQPNGLSNRSR
jgi:hypothetical protein